MPEFDELLAEGWENIETGSPDKARDIAFKALNLNPASPEAHSLMGSALMILGNPADAMNEFDASLQMDPGQPEALLNKIELLAFEFDQADEALQLCEAAMQQIPGEDSTLASALYNMKGRILLNEDRTGESLDAFQTSAELLDDVGETHAWIALLLFDLWRFDEAEASALNAIKLDPEEPLPHYVLGLIRERAGDFAGSRRHFCEASRRDLEAYPEPIQISMDDFQRVVEEAITELPRTVCRYLVDFSISIENLPEPEDCVGGKVPLSPRVFGVFRGEPSSWKSHGAERRGLPGSIAIFRLNVLRACKSREEAVTETRSTLLEEIRNMLGLSESELMSGELS